MEGLKKLIWIYLCETFPNSHRKVTNFGSVLISENGDHGRNSAINTITTLFSCNHDFASQVFSEFILTRPIFYSIPNASNMEVMVSKSPIINSSTTLTINYF